MSNYWLGFLAGAVLYALFVEFVWPLTRIAWRAFSARRFKSKAFCRCRVPVVDYDQIGIGPPWWCYQCEKHLHSDRWRSTGVQLKMPERS